MCLRDRKLLVSSSINLRTKYKKLLKPETCRMARCHNKSEKPIRYTKEYPKVHFGYRFGYPKSFLDLLWRLILSTCDSCKSTRLLFALLWIMKYSNPVFMLPTWPREVSVGLNNRLSRPRPQLDRYLLLSSHLSYRESRQQSKQ